MGMNMEIETEDFLGELRLGKRLTTIGQVSARGLVVVLGLSFLVSSRTLVLVGPVAAAASLLTFIVLGLTLLNILELLGGSSERGGTYNLIHETLARRGGFFAGWSLLAGNIVLAAALMQSAGDHLVLFFPRLAQITPYLSLGLFTAIVIIQLFRLLPRRELLWSVFLILIIALVVLYLDSLRSVDLQFRAAPSTITTSDFMRAASLIAISYVAIEAVLSSRRQVREPGRSLPRGLIATLVVGGLILVVTQLMAAVLLPQGTPPGSTALAHAIGELGPLPEWVIYVVGAASLLIAANACLMTAARELHALSREGALPAILRSLRRPFRVQPFLFGLIFVATTPLILWVPSDWLMDVAAGMFLLPMLLLNLAAIRSRVDEPERRRLVVVPFFPLVPAAALAIVAALLLALPAPGMIGGGIWLALGLVLYLAYGRTHLMEAQEGVLVFGPEPDREKKEGAYRILVPFSRGVERHLLLGLATALACQTDGEVIPLQVIPITDPLAIAEGRRIARERNTLFQWSTRMASRSGVPTFPITRLARSVYEGILDTADEERCDLILMSWPIRSARQDVRMGRVLDPVVREAPCDVAVVAIHPDRLTDGEGPLMPPQEEGGEGEGVAEGKPLLQISRILVPTAGGPHAPLATRLALLLARQYGATTETVYVASPEASQEELATGQVYIEQTLTAMREQMKNMAEVLGGFEKVEDIPIESRVVTAESVVEGIAQAGAESDLVFVGASDESLIDQVLFGTLPEQVAWACPSPVVMVKRFRGLRRFWLQRAWNALFGALPTLSRQEQMTVYRQVRRDARPDVDFFIMMGLSGIIATYGLLQDSTAVIIGAMLVAPLFTPILAFSLAIVQGDIRLLRLAFESALKGVALAIGLSVFLTALSPLRVVTHEIASRTHPNLFDLAVALASGAAGAYAVARKDVAASLPGVAIAAALVPPLGVVGVGLAMGDPGIAGGGGLLFTTNLIAITLAGSVTLLLLGFRPTPRAEREVRLRHGLVVSLALLAVIAIPLGVVFVDSVQESRLRQTIDRTLAQQLGETSDYELVNFDFEEREEILFVTVTVYAQSPIPASLADATREQLSKALERTVDLHLRSIPVEEIERRGP
jgi:uncharacterized hydrophobic protein (TIGR00271 family)